MKLEGLWAVINETEVIVLYLYRFIFAYEQLSRHKHDILPETIRVFSRMIPAKTPPIIAKVNSWIGCERISGMSLEGLCSIAVV